MIRQSIALLFSAVSFSACAPPRATPVPAPVPPSPTLQIGTKRPGSTVHQWTFSFNNEVQEYSSSSQMTLDSDSPGSPVERDTVSVTVHFTVAINRSQIPIVISGFINSVSLNPRARGRINNLEFHTPVAFTGTLDSNRLILKSTVLPESNFCNNSTDSFLGEVRSGVISLPAQLQTDSRWTDTISTTVCSGQGLPSTLQITRSYEVIQEDNTDYSKTLLLKRIDQIRLSGNGTQGQHLIKLEGQGTGYSDITLDAASATVLTVRSYQELTLNILSSGQLKHITQKLKQHISLIP